MHRDDERFAVYVGVFLTIVSALAALGLWGCPQYNVWEKSLRGRAQLRQAEWNRQIAVCEAEASKDAATRLAAAEIERAKGVSEANRIIGESLRGNEAYLWYLWILGLQDGSSEVIYIPTEGNLPILEASRRQSAPGKAWSKQGADDERRVSDGESETR